MKKLTLLFISVIFSLVSFSQEIAVSPTMFNILYTGVDNPLKIVAENYDCDEIQVSTSHGKLKKLGNCSYTIFPMQHKDLQIKVKAVKEKDTIILGVTEFRVKKIPTPVAKINNKAGGNFPKSFFMSASVLKVDAPENFYFDVQFKVSSYRIIIQKGDHELFNKVINDYKFTNEVKEAIGDAPSGGNIIVTEIKATAPDGIEYTTEPIKFIIR